MDKGAKVPYINDSTTYLHFIPLDNDTLAQSWHYIAEIKTCKNKKSAKTKIKSCKFKNKNTQKTT